MRSSNTPPNASSRPTFWILVWGFFWFWMGARFGVPLLFSENAFWASAVNTFVAIGFMSLLGFRYFLKPFPVHSLLGFLAFLYIGLAAFSSSVSPLVTSENVLRVVGLLVSTASYTLFLLLGSRLFHPFAALSSAVRWYVPGLLATTLLLVILGNVDFSDRFGNEELLHPNTLGFAYGLAVLFLSFLPTYRLRFMQIVLGFIFGLLLLLTFSKTAILGVALALGAGGFLLGPIFSLRKVFFVLGFLISATVLAWILQDFILQQLTSYTENPYLVSTLTGRTVLWEWVIQTVAERPWLGFGYRVFQDAIEPFALSMGFLVRVVHAHNAWLDAAFTSGYLGLAVFVLWFVYSVVVILRALRIPERDKNAPKSFLLAMAVFILARSFTEGGLNLGTDFQIFAGLGFLAEAGVRRGFREGPVNPHPLPATRR